LALSVTNLGIDGLEDVEQIGTGGSSRVYRARQVDLDRVVAVKVLNPGGDQGVAKRFDRERKAMGRLSLNDGIVPVYSSGVTAHGEPFLVMPYYPNGSLQDQIDAGPMEWQTAVGYVDVAAETIADAHDEGIVHLDLKPANILLTNTGAPRIADFGIARLMTGSVTAGTTAGTAFTPAYSAPETFLDGETGPPSDVYGLGATLWALLVGHPPFLTPGDDSNLMAVIGRVVNNQVGDLRHIAPEPICAVVEQAMAKSPADRFQSARQFSLALKQAAASTSSDFAPVADATKATTLFPAAATSGPATSLTPDATETTSSAAMGLERPPFQAPAQAAAPAAAQRTLLQETAQALPKPMPAQPNVAPAPFIDLDRFRLGPILLGVLAFALIVGAAAFALFRGGDTTGATDPGDPIDDPASPTSAIETSVTTDSPASTTCDGSTSVSSSTTATTTSTASSASTTATTTASTTETTGGSSTTEPSSTTSESTTTTEATTTSEATTSSTDTTSTTESTTSSTTSTTVVTPDSPVGLTATASADQTDISLSWSAPPTGPTPDGYRVRRNGITIRDNLSRTTFVDRDVEPGTYTYTIVAIGDDGELSQPSNSATITVGPLDITAFTVTRQPTSVLVSFSANKCVTYRIRAISDGVDDPDPVTGPAADCIDSDSVRINGLDADTDYQINLVVNAEGESPVSRVRQAPAPGN